MEGRGVSSNPKHFNRPPETLICHLRVWLSIACCAFKGKACLGKLVLRAPFSRGYREAMAGFPELDMASAGLACIRITFSAQKRRNRNCFIPEMYPRVTAHFVSSLLQLFSA